MAKRVYILTETMRSSKSGFYIEGTDISMDYPDKYPLPFETEVLEDGRPVQLRLLPYCPYLEKEKQLKNGFPMTYNWSDADRDRLTFKFARLELDDVREKIFVDFIERVGWKEGNDDRKTRPNTKTIFKFFDEDALVRTEIEDEEIITKAKYLILGLDDSSIRGLYRLANPGVNRNDGLITLLKMKKHLLQVAEVNPSFIIDGIKTNRDKIVVLVSEAIEKRVVSLDYPGAAAIFNEAENEYQTLINVSDALGPDEKFDRVVEYLQTDEGETDLAIIEKKVAEHALSEV